MSLTEEDKQWISEQLDKFAANMEARFSERIRQSQEATVANIADLREELLLRLDRIDNRLDLTETRIAALDLRFSAIDTHLTGLSKSIAATDAAEARRMAIQNRQQAAIDELYRRLPPTGTGT